MKSSLLSNCFWALNVGVIAVAGYFIYTNLVTYRDEMLAAKRESQKAQGQTYKPKSWIELTSGSTNALTFSSVPIVVGPREVAKEPTKPGPGPDVVVKPPVAVVDLQAKADEIRTKLKEAVTVGLVFTGQSIGGFCYISIKTGGGGKNASAVRDYSLDVGRNLKENPNIKALENGPKDKPRDPFLDFPYLDMTLTEIRTDEFGNRIIALSVDTKDLALERKKVEESQWTPALLPDGRVLVELERSVSAMIDMGSGSGWGDAGSTPWSIGPGDKPKPDLNSGGLVKVEELPTVKTEPVTQWDEEDKVTQVDPNDANAVQVGWEDLNTGTFEDLANYAETWIDPATGEGGGIRVKDSLSSDENNLIKRAGGRSGDIIKSINRQPVRSMTDVRSVVSAQRKINITEFKVVFERNGLDQTKTFKMPKKKENK